MAAIKAYFYKLSTDMPDLCEGVDIPRYIKSLCRTFRAKSLDKIDPENKLPGGPIYYVDAPRNCHESEANFGLEDAISDCLRLFDKKGRARKTVAKMIAEKIVSDEGFRRALLAYNRVPQSWSEKLAPMDPADMPSKEEFVEKLYNMHDRDFSTPTNARGKRHPLARIMESKVFSRKEKLDIVADYIVGRKRKQEVSWALRIGSRGNYTEFNRAAWLEQNGAFVLNTVGDVVELKKHFTASNRMKRNAMPELPQLEAGDLKLDI